MIFQRAAQNNFETVCIQEKTDILHPLARSEEQFRTLCASRELDKKHFRDPGKIKTFLKK